MSRLKTIWNAVRDRVSGTQAPRNTTHTMPTPSISRPAKQRSRRKRLTKREWHMLRPAVSSWTQGAIRACNTTTREKT